MIESTFFELAYSICDKNVLSLLSCTQNIYQLVFFGVFLFCNEVGRTSHGHCIPECDWLHVAGQVQKPFEVLGRFHAQCSIANVSKHALQNIKGQP